MSKDITIKEGSLAKEFGTVKKIRVNNIGGGTSDWVPEAEVQLKSLRVSENGEYNANDEGYYGYNPVIVSGVGGVTYTAEDGDIIGGNELEPDEDYYIDKDGNLVLLPSAIGLALLPSKLVYEEGQHVQLTGGIVRGYKNSSGDWEDSEHPNGIIQHSELTLEPATAHPEYDPGSPDATYAKTIIEGPYSVSIRNCTQDITPLFHYDVSGPAYYPNVALYSAWPQEITVNISSQGTRTVSLSKLDENLYYTNFLLGNPDSSNKYGWPEGTARSLKEEIELDWQSKSNHMKVHVKWARPKDSKILETTFSITVQHA